MRIENRNGNYYLGWMITFITVGCWIFLNGSAIELLYGYIFIPAVMMLLAARYFLHKRKWEIQYYNYFVLLLFVSFNLISYGIYSEQCWGVQQYFVNLMMLVCAFLFAEQFSYKQFKQLFVLLMCIIAVGSLIMHFGAMIAHFNLYATRQGNVMLFGLHNYWAFSVGRNSGPFWEPGAYQIFLNLALLFELYTDGKMDSKRRIKRVILIATVLTTKSTVGYVVLAVLCMKMLKDVVTHIPSKRQRILLWMLYFMAVLAAGYLLYLSEPVQDKFFSYNGSTEMRFNDLKSSCALLFEIPVYGVGINTELKTALLLEKGIVNNSVGILASTINYGIFYMSIYIALAFQNIYKGYGKEKALLLLLIGATNFSQAIFEYPVMMLFLFRFQKQPDNQLNEGVPHNGKNSVPFRCV